MRAALFAVAVLASSLTVGCGNDAPKAKRLSARDAEVALTERNWLDRWPETKQDRLHVYRFVPKMGGGVFQDRTIYKGEFELFQFEAGDGAIDFHFPETKERVSSAYLIERVTGHPPFDLRLVIADDPRGPGVYWGRSDDRGAALDPFVAAKL